MLRGKEYVSAQSQYAGTKPLTIFHILPSHLHKIVHVRPVLILPSPVIVSLQLLTESLAQVVDTDGKQVLSGESERLQPIYREFVRTCTSCAISPDRAKI